MVFSAIMELATIRIKIGPGKSGPEDNASRTRIWTTTMAHTIDMSVNGSRPERQRALAGSRESQRALAPLQWDLHAALNAAQPGREREWARLVGERLRLLAESITVHRQQVEGPDGLYDELRFEAPWMLPRVQRLSVALDALQRSTEALARRLSTVEDGRPDNMQALRDDGEQLLLDLRKILAAEADLAFERFNEPVAMD